MRDIVPPRPRPEDVYLRRSEFLKALEGSAHVNLKELSLAGDQSPATADGSLTAQEFTFPTQRAPKFHGAVKAFIEDLKTRMADRELVAFVIPTAGKVDRLREILKDYVIPFQTATAAAELTGPPGSELQGSGTPDEISGSTPVVPVLITRGRINEGVAFPELRLLLLSDADLFGEFDWGSSGRRERSAASSFISDLSDLKVGDYVVHVDHGIGQYQGLRQLGVNGAERDFMLITYQEDARLYVLLERLDLVEKYRSAEGAKPVLDRLGGVTWARTKARVRRALRDMAQELLQLYAERKMKGGTAYSHDTPWQKEFEGEFEFEETPDQLTALKETGCSAATWATVKRNSPCVLPSKWCRTGNRWQSSHPRRYSPSSITTPSGSEWRGFRCALKWSAAFALRLSRRRYFRRRSPAPWIS